jgi:hypothetical protein
VKKVVYVAGPFRAPNVWLMERNIRRAEEIALEVWLLGAACICPHANTRFFQGVLPDQAYLDGDLAILQRCDALLMLPDWEKSVGAQEERLEAKRCLIPVFYSLPELARWLDHEQQEEKHDQTTRSPSGSDQGKIFERG